MNSTIESILNRPFSEKEEASTYRAYTGYSVFCMCFFLDFRKLSKHEQACQMTDSSIHDTLDYERHDARPHIYDRPTATVKQLHKLCGYKWNRMKRVRPELIQAWKERALEVNLLPVLGKVDKFDNVVVPHSLLLNCINAESERMRSFFRSALLSYRKERRQKTVLKKHTFHKEKFEEGTQVFRTVYFNLLLSNFLLGPDLSFLRCHEVIHRSAKLRIVHIASRKRMVELFSLKNVSYFEIFDDEKLEIQSAAGQMSVVDVATGLVGIGYVLDENRNGKQLEVMLENNKRIVFESGPKLRDDGVWECGQLGSPLLNNDEQYRIMDYNPIRLKIHLSGWLHITYNHIVLSLNNTKIIPL